LKKFTFGHQWIQIKTIFLTYILTTIGEIFNNYWLKEECVKGDKSRENVELKIKERKATIFGKIET